MSTSGRRRVLITGIGAVTGGGVGHEAFWSWITSPTDGPVQGKVDGFDASRWLGPKQRRRSDPFAQYAVAASQLALDDAGRPDVDPTRAGIVLSTVYGALETYDAEADTLVADGPDAVSPFLTALACENASAALTSIELGWRGPAKVVVGACAGGAYAVADGADLIRAGRCDVVLAGGTQGAITPLLLSSYRNLRVLSGSGWERPFDRRRDGFVFAEGGMVLVLEGEDHARARGATVYGELLGSAATSDADSMVSPSGRGAEECMRLALADAGLEPGDVAAVNAHGTGTLLNDKVEAEALHAVFGAAVPPVSAIKRITGHSAGASGAYEAAACALAIHHRALPQSGTAIDVDDGIDLDLVVGPEPRPWEPGPTISNSFGLGGHNGCLVIAPA